MNEITYRLVMLSTLYQTPNDVWTYTEIDKAMRRFESMKLNRYQSCVLEERKGIAINRVWERYGKNEF